MGFRRLSDGDSNTNMNFIKLPAKKNKKQNTSAKMFRNKHTSLVDILRLNNLA